MQREMCMLVIQRQGEQYWVFLFPTGNQLPSFGLAPKSFLEKKSLTDFLLNTLQMPQELIDKAVQDGFIQLSSEQIECWPA